MRFPTYEESMVTTKENFFNLYGKFYKLTLFDKEENYEIPLSSGQMTYEQIERLYLFLKTPLNLRFGKFKTDNVSLYAASFLNTTRHRFLNLMQSVKDHPTRFALNFAFYSYGNGGAIIHYPSKSIFLETPKCATTSLKSIPDSEFLYVTQTELETTYHDFKVYSIIRNPFERFISAFFELKHRVKDVRWPREIYDQSPYSDIFVSDDDVFNFSRFVDAVEQVGTDFDAHVQSMSWYLFDSVENRPYRVDKLINFNNLSEVSAVLGFHHPLERKNAKASEPEKDPLRNLILDSESLRNRIKQIYREDFELFRKSSI